MKTKVDPSLRRPVPDYPPYPDCSWPGSRSAIEFADTEEREFWEACVLATLRVGGIRREYTHDADTLVHARRDRSGKLEKK